ncbi:hypothetical protein T310_2953 [Rasamsonia emersonii CBS 393.64]|uniref:Uncharacterized protein n=1 Tax=Rasamsonia emersonii (strain ATCC 16479 / CBS 393.64 / IMI 116815) TaxID=1408163 RepID=A0A0F4YXU7_RASE3|nr:hypothetical protein T310_2953 [Rasamsonia emersonii CBS 393.64]KKA23074.1 hypothetical protein T310_2953 [Rasamsonia emersonii CBS 393.64]
MEKFPNEAGVSVPRADMAGTDTAATLNATPYPVLTTDEFPNDAGTSVPPADKAGIGSSNCTETPKMVKAAPELIRQTCPADVCGRKCLREECDMMRRCELANVSSRCLFSMNRIRARAVHVHIYMEWEQVILSAKSGATRLGNRYFNFLIAGGTPSFIAPVVHGAIIKEAGIWLWIDRGKAADWPEDEGDWLEEGAAQELRKDSWE